MHFKLEETTFENEVEDIDEFQLQNGSEGITNHFHVVDDLMPLDSLELCSWSFQGVFRLPFP